MNTAEVAAHLGTTPKILRAFLRSSSSTFRAVGSGARYNFTESDLPVLAKKFSEWNRSGKPKVTPVKRSPRPRASVEDRRQARDREIWEEEGPVQLDDIRDPRVRKRVLAAAKEAEDRLMLKLMAAGLHVTQLGDRS